jgi:hypothetical protein
MNAETARLRAIADAVPPVNTDTTIAAPARMRIYRMRVESPHDLNMAETQLSRSRLLRLIAVLT